MIRSLLGAAAAVGLLAPYVAEAGDYHRRHHHAHGYGSGYGYGYGYGRDYRQQDLYGGTGDFPPRPSSYRAVEVAPVQAARYSYSPVSGWVRLGEDEAPRDQVRPAAPVKPRR